jgi:hypothetical protein
VGEFLLGSLCDSNGHEATGIPDRRFPEFPPDGNRR